MTCPLFIFLLHSKVMVLNRHLSGRFYRQTVKENPVCLKRCFPAFHYAPFAVLEHTVYCNTLRKSSRVIQKIDKLPVMGKHDRFDSGTGYDGFRFNNQIRQILSRRFHNTRSRLKLNHPCPGVRSDRPLGGTNKFKQMFTDMIQFCRRIKMFEAGIDFQGFCKQ